jgi:hypothetical protein
MLDNIWAQSFDAKKELRKYSNSTDIIIRKLALITKVKPDGSTKHHFVWDFLRSKVNSLIHQGERVILPRVSDFVDGILLDANNARQPSHDRPIWLFGIDISDAFHQILLNNSEKRFTVACINEKLRVFHCLVFGSGSAPTARGRFAAFLGRSTAAIANENFHMQIYVDDPGFSCRGRIDEASTQFTMALLWAIVLGYPLAWRKADGGQSITWIGTAITAHPTNVEVSFPRDKCRELATKTSTTLRKTVITTRELRSLAGSLNFIAEVVHPLRPFLSPLWAALSSRKPDEGGRARKARRHDRLPKGLVEVQQCKHALRWITAFLDRQRGTISRITNYTSQPTSRRRISFHLRSDSLSALSSIFRGSPRSPSLNNIVAEILLDEAELYNSLTMTVHIPGVANIQPDALSRLSAPSPSTIPQALRAVPRLLLPPRDESFWLTLGPERKKSSATTSRRSSKICSLRSTRHQSGKSVTKEESSELGAEGVSATARRNKRRRLGAT